MTGPDPTWRYKRSLSTPDSWAKLQKLRAACGLTASLEMRKSQVWDLHAVGYGHIPRSTVRSWEKRGWVKLYPDPDDYRIEIADRISLKWDME